MAGALGSYIAPLAVRTSQMVIILVQRFVRKSALSGLQSSVR